MMDSEGHMATTSGPGRSSLEYRIIAMPQVPFSPTSCRLWGDEHDMERDVLYIPPSVLARYQRYAKHSYVPVQSIPQGLAKPDVIADLYSGDEHVTTLHFCAIWNRVQRNNQPWRWERVSFRDRRDVTQYYCAVPQVKGYLSVCQSCLHIHPPYSSCPLSEPMGLDEALSLTGLALRVHQGNVYLVSWNPYVPLYGDLWHGRISWHAITRLSGLQRAAVQPFMFVEMDEGSRFLFAQDVPLEEGWIAVDECPGTFQ